MHGKRSIVQLKSGKRDSNPRPSVWETDALPAELLPQKNKETDASFSTIKLVFVSCFYKDCKNTLQIFMP